MRACILLALLALQIFAADSLRVMTFNVRLMPGKDGPNAWDNRRDLLVETVRKYNPDIMGTQELFHAQGQYIVEKLPDYKWFGVSRRGNQQDEHMGVFYRPDRLRLIESGNYWLSEKPEEPGSISWNMSLPRMVTWGLFEDLRSKRRFRFFNTHFAHRREDSEARLNSAQLIASRLRQLSKDATVILTGDFNTGDESDGYRALTAVLSDAKPAQATGTFHGFSGKPGRDRIDWILYRGAVKPVSSEIVMYNQDGRYPSDHFPVFVAFEWQ